MGRGYCSELWSGPCGPPHATIASVDPILSYTQTHTSAIAALIRQLVECESPTDDPAAVNRFVELVSDAATPLAAVKSVAGGRFGKHLLCEMKLPGRRKTGQILALGHSDTVWPPGTLRTMPFREAEGRLWGPGALDMKAGIAFFLWAAKALRELEVAVPARVLLQLNSDEEAGSPSSRALTEKNAARSGAVLVLEPGTGLEGKLKTARKGVGGFTIAVHGKAAHAGVDFEAGASAVVELARQVERLAGFTQLHRGITVNPGVIAGGTRSNVVAAEARAEVDIRVLRLRDAPLLEKKFRALKPFDKRCTLEVAGGLNRPPMERSAATARLFRTARALASELGVKLEESLSGGGSDGNFTAAMGVPTLDGLGGVGEGIHAPHESVLVNRIADRTALLAKLLASIG
ncbi:MAG: M20 family metallopeptidase [Acidobacteriia bacterium]|nr:M20 family metallopeptidase [Terriglobia bacterium]